MVKKRVCATPAGEPQGAAQAALVDLTSPESRNNDNHGEQAVKKRLKTALKTSFTSVSEHYLCPISHELMVDPVLAADGNM